LISIVLGFATSVVYGFADFFGAIAAKKINALLVTLVAGVSGLVFLLAITPFFGLPLDATAIFWGILSGVFSALAISLLYASLAIGPISILSPLGAIVSALIPMAFGVFVVGEKFSQFGFLALIGILVAVGLVGFSPGADVRLPSLRGALLAIGAGGSIGLVLIFLDQTPADSGLTPIVFLRAFSALTIGVILLATLGFSKHPIQKQSNSRLWLAAGMAGILDSTANVLFLNAIRLGELSAVAVLTALYPLGTIILARIFLKEKIAKLQLTGVLLALACSALLASGI
jgi:drug/metabolite transporter (DMT)-like permease